MTKKILILNPKHNLEALCDFFIELKKLNFNICLLSKNKKLIKNFQENNLNAKKIVFWPQPNSIKSLLLTFIFFPIIFIVLTVYLSFIKIKKEINTIICFSHFDKIITTKIAHLLKIRVIWLIYPDLQDCKQNRFLKFLIRKNAKKTQIITITKNCYNKIADEKFKSSNIKSLNPGIKIKNLHQENIFEKMANNDKKNQLKKFFTLGTILNLSSENNLETIFKAIKKTLTVIPNLQFIIIGEGEEIKQFKWLTKKMGIENLVWFVGKQAHLDKWFENLDIYIISSLKNTLFDINNTLRAMNAKLPIFAPDEDFWSEIIEHEKNGLTFDNPDSDILAQEIIKIKKDFNKKNRLAENAKKTIEEKHQITQTVAKFVEFL